jgi:predicted nucleic acid-binding protein
VLAYLDSSAITKLVVEEPESAALRRDLSAAASRLVTSVVSEIETRRALRRAGGDAGASERLAALFSRLDLVALTPSIRLRAGTLDPPELRSFDAAHIATALSHGDELDILVCYDARLSAAAALHGLRVLAPVR